MTTILLSIVFAPLIGCLISGLFGKAIGRRGAHWVTNIGVGLSTVLSLYVLQQMLSGQFESINFTLYQWGVSGTSIFQIGFLVDPLTVLMMVVVSFVSLMVHIYTIGYMSDDPGYQRFFSYISLFTFSMLMLVMSNNFLQLFFGWEAVGVVSYLLIGFWFKRPTATYASLKAFLVNRVGDLGFLLGIAAVYMYFGSLDYSVVFANAPAVAVEGISVSLWSGLHVSVLTLICILLFIGAMGKSAQMPLHVWLPDSMEGPTPISALIHAATMVTAGVFMVSRMSPLFEHSEVARSVVLIIGALTALLMGLLGIVQNDIKRIIAYSTLSQLGYMIAALGASAYAAGIFHLMTHAFFKALLFLAAGSVIIAMHHEQDIRKMGNLKKYMPITYITCLIGSIALAGIPPFSGFYSKDLIIEAIGAAHLPGSSFAYFAVVISVFVTALYTFRLLFLVFHTQERMDEHTRAHLTESRAVVWVPLVLLAIPSALIGGLTIYPLLFEPNGFFANSLFIFADNNPLLELAGEFHGAWNFAGHALITLPFWLAVSGVVVAWLFYVRFPKCPAWVQARCQGLYQFMINKYGFDSFNQIVFAAGARLIGHALWRGGDQKVIDGVMINGSAQTVGRISKVIRHIQSGYLFHYAFAMIIGLFILMIWLFIRLAG